MEVDNDSDTTMEPSTSKKRKVDPNSYTKYSPKKEAKAQTDGKDTSGHGTGVSGSPIPMTYPQSQRKIDMHTVTAGGTTFIEDAYDSGATLYKNNKWVKFPWEYPRLFMNEQQILELANTWLYWKCTQVEVSFKNPVCIQEYATNQAVAGNNLQAQLFSWLDELYMTGLWTNPNSGPSITLTTEELDILVNSFMNNGINTSGTPVQIKGVALPHQIVSSNHPECKQMGMGPGQQLKHVWNVKSPYWRSTQEFFMLPATDSSTYPLNENCLSRVDEYLGIVSNALRDQKQITTQYATNQWGAGIDDVNDPLWQLQDRVGETGLNMPIGMPYMDSDPIPNLFLQLQPQVNAIASGVGETIAQLQFEVSYKFACMGRIPRRTRLNSTMVNPYHGASSWTSYAGLVAYCNGIPVFYPIGDVSQAEPVAPKPGDPKENKEIDYYNEEIKST